MPVTPHASECFPYTLKNKNNSKLKKDLKPAFCLVSTLIPKETLRAAFFGFRNNFKKGNVEKRPREGGCQFICSLCGCFNVENMENSLMAGIECKLGRCPTALRAGYAYSQCSMLIYLINIE